LATGFDAGLASVLLVVLLSEEQAARKKSARQATEIFLIRIASFEVQS
jgi:hypothetical protein